MFGKIFSSSCLVIICLMNSACSSKPDDQPDLGQVTGIVVLDGTPMKDALVQFMPEKGRSSQGLTNGEGVYELSYVRQTKGAVIGMHKVIIVTSQEEIDDSDPEAPIIEEKIPAKYNTESTLTAEVIAGKNSINFELLSK